MAISWEISELGNGLRVVTTPVASSQAVSVSVFVGAGSRGEERRLNGLSHFLEHMLFKGTRRWPSAIALAEAIEGAGGTLNAYTTKEFTCYWNQLPFDRFQVAVEVLADMLANSLLDPGEIEREKTVVQQEIKRTRDQPGAWVGELLSRAAYGDQPIGWSVAGSEETVAGVKRQHFVAYMERWYLPRNTVVSVAGRIRHEETMAVAERLFGGWPSGQPPAFSRARSRRPEQHVLVEGRDIAQANIALGLRALSRRDPDRYTLQLLNSVLGRGMSSRLFKEVRERRGLAYSVGSSISRHNDTGLLAISAGVSPENLKEAFAVILTELRKLVEEPVGEEELTKARDYTIGNFRLSLETAMALGQRAGESLLTMGEIEPVETVVEELAAVTAADIQRVAARILRGDNLAVSVVGPGASEEELRELLTL